jgi:uncharacterized protein YlaI
VIISPRVLIGAAPALVVVAGSFLLSRVYVHDQERTAKSAAITNEPVSQPTAADEECQHRLAIKLECTDDLLSGRITFEEAVARFESLIGVQEEEFDPTSSGSKHQRAIAQALSFARNQARYEAERFQAMLSRIEAEAATLLPASADHGNAPIVR